MADDDRAVAISHLVQDERFIGRVQDRQAQRIERNAGIASAISDLSVIKLIDQRRPPLLRD